MSFARAGDRTRYDEFCHTRRVPVPSVMMRAPARTLAALAVSLLLVLSLAPGVSTAASGEAVQLCTASDPRLNQITGLVATPNGYAVVNKTGDELAVYLLGRDCSVVRLVTAGRQYPNDVEDLARTSDGNYWVADIGDTKKNRPAVAVWQVDPNTEAVVRHKLVYPDGSHDAAAMVIQPDKTAVIVTKEPSGAAKVYVASAPLTDKGTSTIRMRSAGTVTIASSGTNGGPPSLGQTAQLEVTGGAISSDGTKVALRTYTDAYQWDVSNGGVASALTSGTPQRTPLAGEPQGEAISYTSDGTALITLSFGAGQPLQQWGTGSANKSSSSKGSGSWLPDLNVNNLMKAVYVVGFVGAALLIAGIIGIRKFRASQAGQRRQAEDDPPVDDHEEYDYPEYGDDHDDYDAVEEGYDDQQDASLDSLLGPRPSVRQPEGPRGTTYGSPVTRQPSPPPAQGTVYGSPRGTVYGGRSSTTGEDFDDPPRRPGTVYGSGGGDR